ncbi:MAG: hypothetical protein D6753_10450 [Planctomycetota bacterium]|nr:MAG: hypothetical protein D6753_10450 [Planctomycetota bacterium]
MQIPPLIAAAGAGGVVSQSGAKDPGKSLAGGEAPNANPSAGEHVEQAESANRDRDAQGQGDGLGERGERQHQPESSPDSGPPQRPAPPLPGEEPGELDILG